MKTLHTAILALILASLGGAIMAYKVGVLGLPLKADASATVWTVESQIEIRSASPGPVRIEQAIPSKIDSSALVDEHFISAEFDPTVESEADGRRVIWTARRMEGSETLYYRLQVAPGVGRQRDAEGSMPEPPPVPHYGEPFATAVQGLLDEIRQASADVESFARLLVQRYNTGDSEHIDLLRKRASSPEDHARNLVDFLAGARIPARVIWTLPLRREARQVELEPWLEVFHSEGWFAINPATAKVGFPNDRILWLRGGDPTVKTTHAEMVDRSLSTSQVDRRLIDVIRSREDPTHSLLLGLTLFDLPVQTQQVLQLILLVPLGAFVVVVMRNVVGINTFGTFMPVLMALAFRETELLLGVALFVGIVAIALTVRFYLEHLHLLLVPRLSVVLTTIVLILLALALGSHRLGFDQALSVALFPMVILAMVVERMSILWEESGPGEAITQGLGSLVVAALTYVLMNWSFLQYLVFVFPEFLFVVVAPVLLLGRYTGYRVSELWRFRYVLFENERWR